MKLHTYVALMLALVTIGPAAAGQTTPYARAGLSLHIHWLQPHYGSASTPPGGFLLRGEPWIVELTLIDKPREAVTAAEVDWPQRVVLHLARVEPGGTTRTSIGDLPCQNRFVPITLEGVETQGNLVVLTASRAQTLRCRLTLEEYDLRAGRYVIAAQWSRNTLTSGLLGRTFFSDRIEEIEFEVREVRSRADVIDLNLHLATRAMHDDRDPERALEFAERALSLEPRSFQALLLAGNAEMALRRCSEARERWRQAGEVLSTREDRRRGERVLVHDARRAGLSEELTQRLSASCK